MRHYAALGLILLVLVPVLHAEDIELEWQSFDQASQLAAEQGRPILVDFYTDWCHWCKVMDAKTFNDPAVAQILSEDFFVARIHADDESGRIHYQDQGFNNVEFTRAMGIKGFPSIAFFDSHGRPITIVPGFVEPEVFKYILAYVRDGCYKRQMSFQEFMDRKGDCE